MKRPRTSDLGPRTSRGMTLTEVMMSVAIVGIIGVALTTLFLKWLQFWQVSRVNSEIQADARTCLELIDRNLRQATSTSVVVDAYSTAQPPYSRISFQKAGNPIIYYQNGQKLYEVADSTRAISETLRCIQFVYPQTVDGSIINVGITMEKKIYGTNTRVIQMSIQKVRIMN